MKYILPIIALTPLYGCKAPKQDTSSYEVKTSIASNHNRIDDSRYFNYNSDDSIEISGTYLGCDGHTDNTERWTVFSNNPQNSTLKNISNVDTCKISVDEVIFRGKEGSRYLSYIDTRDSPFYDVLGKTYTTGNNNEYRPVRDGFTGRLYFNPSQKRSGVFGEDYYLDQYSIGWNSTVDDDNNQISMNFSFTGSGEDIDIIEATRDDSYKRPPKQFVYSFYTNQLSNKSKSYKLSMSFISPISLRGKDTTTEEQKKNSIKSVSGVKGTLSFSIPRDTPISYCTIDIGNLRSQKYYPGVSNIVNIEDILGNEPLSVSYNPIHSKKPQMLNTIFFARCFNSSDRNIISRRFDVLISPK